MLDTVILLYNIEKNTNLGQLIRTANALGVKEVCVLGKKKFATFGNQRTNNHTQFRHFYQFDAAQAHYKSEGYDIVGIEITPTAISVNAHNFTHNTLFVLGNEANGIRSEAIDQCDYCIYIPQYGSGASINVNVACGIVLNSFKHQSNHPHNPIDGNKFVKPIEPPTA